MERSSTLFPGPHFSMFLLSRKLVALRRTRERPIADNALHRYFCFPGSDFCKISAMNDEGATSEFGLEGALSGQFHMSNRLPPYIFKTVNDLKAAARSRGEDVIDLGMGNPDIPTPRPIVNKLIEAAKNPRNHRYSVSRGIPKLR